VIRRALEVLAWPELWLYIGAALAVLSMGPEPWRQP